MTHRTAASPRFFSQNGEDHFAHSVLGRPSSGFFVEVGAFDGVFLSGTYAFELLGWRASMDFARGLERTVQWYLANRGAAEAAPR